MKSVTKIYYWIDHTSSCQTNTGVQRLTRCLAKELLAQNKELIFVCWDSQQDCLVLASQPDLAHLSRWMGPTFTPEELSYYPKNRARAIPVHDSTFKSEVSWLFIPEVTHITTHSTPPTLAAISYAKHHHIKTAFIFYDAIPLKLSAYESSKEMHERYMQHLALADVLIPISNFAADDLITYYTERLGFDESTMPMIVPLALPGEIQGIPRKNNNVDSSNPDWSILCFGTIEPRKNQDTLIRAFESFQAIYPDCKLKLIFAGNLSPLLAPIINEATTRNPSIEYVKHIPDEKLNQLLEDCLFTVFPSVEEGFGFPIVESLWRGKPAICANFGAMAETAEGGGCYLVDTSSEKELTEALATLIFDDRIRTTLTSEARTRHLKSWQEYALEILSTLSATTDKHFDIKKILYWVDHTCTYAQNSGIQRVVRALGRGLTQFDIPIEMVKWNQLSESLATIDENEGQHLEKWNGPTRTNLQTGDKNDSADTWLLIPELTTYLPEHELKKVLNYAKRHNYKTAIIFYDAIPSKLVSIYPPEATAAHRQYMRQLVDFDLVIPISETSSFDLQDFLYDSIRANHLQRKIRTCTLPGEFLESQRVTKISADDNRKTLILCVSTIEPRKNHTTLLKAFELFCSRNPKTELELVLIGGCPFPDLEAQVADFTARLPNLTWLNHTDDKTLHELYKQANFTVYPSLEEGFGLPILESIWYGRPCICRNTGSMMEIARDGGCLAVDTTDANTLCDALEKLTLDLGYRNKLNQEAITRALKSWRDYTEGVLTELHNFSQRENALSAPLLIKSAKNFYKPLLSICITTYNRADWLRFNLQLLVNLTSAFRDIIEIVVCDNASVDATPEIVKPFLDLPNFAYYRNPKNVGMLGNLKVTAHYAKGQYVWVLGDDDVLIEGTIEKVLMALIEQPDAHLVYLNYAYTRLCSPDDIQDYPSFTSTAIPIVEPTADIYDRISQIAVMNENFFTAIYTCIFRRDHALKAYSQDTSGIPFSNLLTCVPTTNYVCNNMFELPGYWIGTPCIVVNMNVSWGKYAPIWALERLPDIYDLAEVKGSKPEQVDRWRTNNFENGLHFMNELFTKQEHHHLLPGFSLDRWLRRNRHLVKYAERIETIQKVIQQAYNNGILKESSTLIAGFLK